MTERLARSDRLHRCDDPTRIDAKMPVQVFRAGASPAFAHRERPGARRWAAKGVNGRMCYDQI